MKTKKLKRLARLAKGRVWSAFINEKTNTFAIHTPDNARCGNIVDWMGFDGVDCSKRQKAHNARFIAAFNPAIAIELIDALESAERQRDELRRLAESQSKLAGTNAARAQKAEAEIERRDAAPGEAVGYIDPASMRKYRGVMAGGSWSSTPRGGEYNQTLPIYTTPPAASGPNDLATAVNLLLDSDGSRGTFSAIRRGDALAEVERLLAAAPAPGGVDA